MMEVFYKHDEIIHNFSAAREIMPYIIKNFSPSSMLDVGCGIGTWMVVAKELGIQEVLGIDGSYVDRDILKINSQEFLEHDLRDEFNLSKKFDIALCLEVAEHLPASSAEGLIKSLCKHSDIIVFSAAIPNQGGQNHLNEQWPEYWIKLFMNLNFSCYDIIRPVFWNNLNVDFWYKQNILVFSKKNFHQFDSTMMDASRFNIIHPELYKKVFDRANLLCSENQLYEKNINKPGINFSIDLLIKAIKLKFM